MPPTPDQFLDVLPPAVALRRWLDACPPRPLPAEPVPLDASLGRVLAIDVHSPIDIPAFDRSNVDGYALRSADTLGAAEHAPLVLRLNPESLPTAALPRLTVEPGTATPIATGAMLPRGSDAVLMVEHARLDPPATLLVHRPLAPGANLTFAGTDVALGEIPLRRGTLLTPRETSLLAALGLDSIPVLRRPRVAILSTGDELLTPGSPPRPACLYDANATFLAHSCRDLGAEPISLGIIPDDPVAIESAIDRALALPCDLLLLTGGTSKGDGDLSYRALARRSPGLLVHGVALKPGKPLCLGAIGPTPVAILPGFPTSAAFTFAEFVAPLLRRLTGRPPDPTTTVTASLPDRLNSDRGRSEFVLVRLLDTPNGPVALPLGKGSGSVAALSAADGYLTIPQSVEFLDPNEPAPVTRIGRPRPPDDLVVVGSHCPGLEALLGLLADLGFSSHTLWVGSHAGLAAATRAHCDLAGTHLLDPVTQTYNQTLYPPSVHFLPGYGRMQGLVHRPDDPRFLGPIGPLTALDDPSLFMVNRNRASGTRTLIDQLLAGRRPPGYAIEARSHHAVAASVRQGRADWGLTIAPVASSYGLAFHPLRSERYDFAIPASRSHRPAVIAFNNLLHSDPARSLLTHLGFLPDPP